MRQVEICVNRTISYHYIQTISYHYIHVHGAHIFVIILSFCRINVMIKPMHTILVGLFTTLDM